MWTAWLLLMLGSHACSLKADELEDFMLVCEPDTLRWQSYHVRIEQMDLHASFFVRRAEAIREDLMYVAAQ